MHNVSGSTKGVVGRMTVYCAVDNDKYERIRFIADTQKELSEMVGIKHCSLRSYLCRGQSWFGYKFIRVEID